MRRVSEKDEPNLITLLQQGFSPVRSVMSFGLRGSIITQNELSLSPAAYVLANVSSGLLVTVDTKPTMKPAAGHLHKLLS